MPAVDRHVAHLNLGSAASHPSMLENRGKNDAVPKVEELLNRKRELLPRAEPVLGELAYRCRALVGSESHGLPGAIQVTERAYERLRQRYELQRRGTIEVKGKGPMTTYLLIGRQDARSAQPNGD
jgi:hypothetical protein